ncbi:MAG: PKD domain-containing protein [Alloacidobacterium sp.]
MHLRTFWLVLVVASLGSASAVQSQTVSANFGNLSGSTPVVPSGLFSIGGTGSNIQDQGPISTLTTAGLYGTRFWIPLEQIYATSTANFSLLDANLERMQTAGLHPLGVIANTPPSLGSTPCAPPSNVSAWGQMAASVVAHVDQKFPGLMQDYEIWNEPELASSLCITNPTTALNTYLSMFAAAASAMHAQAAADGETIRTGGPVISVLSLAPTWIPALLNNKSTAPYVDFVSFHLYITGQSNIDAGMTWSQLYTYTQSPTVGLAHYYNSIEPLVRKGLQPNAATTPIYITEYNDNWAYAVDCCRNNPTFGSLWNSTAITDFLNVVYSGATAVPSKLGYFNSAGNNYFCILGQWNAAMDCNPSATDPYPQFYAYQLFASPNYLDLQAGGHMAASVSPSSTTSGLDATAFYTSTADDVVIINPTASDSDGVHVSLTNTGLMAVTGTEYLLNVSNGQISTHSAVLSPTSTAGNYSAVVNVPAYSTVALSVKGTAMGAPPHAVLSVTPKSGTHPLLVTIDSSKSTGGGTAISGRTINFGDGTWVNWTPSVSHTYAKAGSYTVLLTLKNLAGQLSTASTTITVN